MTFILIVSKINTNLMEALTAIPAPALEAELTVNLYYALDDGEILDTTGTIQLEYLESSFDGVFRRDQDWKHFCNQLEKRGAEYIFMRWNKKHKQGISNYYPNATVYFPTFRKLHGLQYGAIRVLFDSPREVVVAHVAEQPVIMPIKGFEAELEFDFYHTRGKDFATAADFWCNITKLI